MRTRAGLVLRACGENHASAHALGYQVQKIRLAAIMFGGGCAGVAGAYLSLAYTPFWSPGMTAGRGWIALASIALLAATYVHLQALVTQVEQLKARSGVQRVAEFLVDLAACEQGKCSVSMPYNKTLIAGRLGMKPESLSRAFGRLRAYGVRVDANVAHIDDLDVLRDLTNEDPGKAWMK